MPIRPLLASGSFSPEDVTLLCAAFDDCLSQLCLVDRNDPTVIMVAKRVISLAQAGQRDPVLLRDQVVKSFTNGVG